MEGLFNGFSPKRSVDKEKGPFDRGLGLMAQVQNSIDACLFQAKRTSLAFPTI